jgi:anti-sigma factor RsiW
MSGNAPRDEIEKLLPWYVTGRLDGADRCKVESFLREHPEMTAELDLIRAERREAVRVSEAQGYPPPNMMQRLMHALPRGRFRLRSFVADLWSTLAVPEARNLRWAALIVGMIVIAQAGVIAGFVLGNGEHVYRQAAGPGQASGGFSALVVFSDQATAASIARLLGEFNANIVDGPKPGNVYKIRLRAADGSQGARDALLRALAERRDVIRIVLPGGD